MTDNAGRVSEAASGAAGVAADALLVILATAAVIFGAPFYLLARVLSVIGKPSLRCCSLCKGMGEVDGGGASACCPKCGGDGLDVIPDA